MSKDSISSDCIARSPYTLQTYAEIDIPIDGDDVPCRHSDLCLDGILGKHQYPHVLLLFLLVVGRAVVLVRLLQLQLVEAVEAL